MKNFIAFNEFKAASKLIYHFTKLCLILLYFKLLLFINLSFVLGKYTVFANP